MTALDVITLDDASLCSCGSPVAPGEPVGFDRERRVVVCRSCLRSEPGVDLAALAQALSGHAHGRFGAHAVAAMDLAALSADATLAPPELSPARGPERADPEPSTLDQPTSGTIRLLGRSRPNERAAHAAMRSDRAVAQALAEAATSGDVQVLSGRRVPGSRAYLDHLVVAGTGVHVIGAERLAGSRVTIRQAGGVVGPRRADLYIRGRQRNDLVHGVERLAASVRTVLDGTGLTDTPVTPILCLVEGSFPLLRSTLTSGHTRVMTVASLRRFLGRSGRLDAAARDRVYVSLAASLPAVT